MRSSFAEPVRVFRRSLAAAATVLLLSCSGAPAPQAPAAAPAAQPARVKVVPQESWRGAVLYFVITDRFADGDPGNDRNVDINAKGTFHGGDLKGGGLRPLPEVAREGARRPSPLPLPLLARRAGALYQLKGDKELFRLAALLEMTASGIPMIYYGEEVGRPGGDWPDNRSDMPWGDRKIPPGAGKPRDEASHDAVVVAINRGSAPAMAAFDAPAEWGAAPVRDVWTGEPVSRTGGRIEVTVAPKGARIFAIK